LDAKLDQLDKPSIKIAEDFDEFCQAFKVLHDVYLSSGYLPHEDPSGMHLGLHHLLPKTCVFVFKTYLTVLSTMSYIPDSPEFGLPMDDLYKDELDVLRDSGRKVVELGSLATTRHRCWQNLMVFLSKAVFQYALCTDADDLCIMVNPKHVRFYNSIFLFQPFAEERHYAKVDAPAVALRVDMRNIEPALRHAYSGSDFDTDLHSFFVKINSHAIDTTMDTRCAEKNAPLNPEIAEHLLLARPELVRGLSLEKLAELERLYPAVLHRMPRLHI
jgi:hypothetical protein